MKDKKQDSITMWNNEALKNHMSYGHYRAAVECGALPAPRWYKGKAKAKKDTQDPKPEPDFKCIICGTPFHRKYSIQVCCCADCQKERDAQKRCANQKRYREQKKGETTPIKEKCAICGGEFIMIRTNQCCCSDECRKKWRAIKQAEYRQMRRTKKRGEANAETATM